MFSAAISLSIGDGLARSKYSQFLSIVDWCETREPSSKYWRVVLSLLLSIVYWSADGVGVDWRLVVWSRCCKDRNKFDRCGVAVSGG